MEDIFVNDMSVDPELDRLYREHAIATSLSLPTSQQIDIEEEENHNELDSFANCKSTFSDLTD